MANLLGNLRVRLTAETEDFRRGMTGARTNLTSFRKELTNMRGAAIAQVASLAAVTAALGKSLQAASALGKAERELSASAKIAGQDVDTLRSIVQRASSEFSLGKLAATEYTTELARLADRAGGLKEPTRVLESFLDLGAARGMNATETLEAFREAVKGSEDAMYSFFNQKPDQLFERFARSIGTTAGNLTEQQKAQALADAALKDGEAARGEYQKWLASTEGLQHQLTSGMEDAASVVGKALEPAIIALVPIMKAVAHEIAVVVRGGRIFNAMIERIPSLLRAAKHAVTGNFAEAGKELARSAAEWREALAEINATSGIDIAPVVTKPLTGRGAPGSGTGETGKADARAYFDALEAEWENLRHSVTLVGFEVMGTDSERLAAEEAHELRLLDIEEEHIQARHRLKELTDHERDESLRQLGIRRQIVQTRRAEMDAARSANETVLASFTRQALLLDDAVERTRMLGDVALTRLGSEATIEERLQVQLSTAAKIAETKRSALLADVRLTDTQLANELQLLDLAYEREQIALRMTADAERAAQAQTRRDGQIASIKDLGLSIAGDAISGRGVDGATIGAGIGRIAGEFVPIPFAEEVLSTLGGALGGLFGKDDKGHRVINQLEAIEFAQRETIAAISQQTDELLGLESRVLGAPTNFAIPGYAPQFGGGGGGATTNVRNDYRVEVSVSVAEAADTRDIGRVVERAVAQAIRDGRTETPRGRNKYA